MSIKSIIKDATNRFGNVYLSEGSLKSAFYKVRRELREMGLMFAYSRLDEVKYVYEKVISKETWEGIKGYMGFYFPSDGNIHIPAVCSAALNPWCEKRFITNVLRHEFGHALEDKFPKFFYDERFRKAFGDEYGENHVAKDGDEDNYVSSYARKYTQEDFAETFMLFMKHKGILPEEFSSRKAIRKKWETVAAICKDIAKLKK